MTKERIIHMSTSTSRPEWPAQLRVGALRVVRSSNHFEATVAFYRDLVGLEVIEEFRDSYSEDGTIFGLPDSSVHLEIVRSTATDLPIDVFDQLVPYLPNHAAVHEATKKLIAHGARPAQQHPYWRVERRGHIPRPRRTCAHLRAVDLRTRLAVR